MGSISIREHIKWGSEPSSEPTSTIVLTSPRNRHFVDIRILNEALAKPSQDNLSRDDIDWAIGGASSSAQVTLDDGSQVSRSTFRHWVSSRTKDVDGVVDVGDMVPGEKEGTTLETGRMLNPATGVDTAYEELWRDEEPEAVSGLPTCCVFRLQDDGREERGLFVQLGRHAQSVLRVGDAFTAERWLWRDSSSRWERLLKAGDEKMPNLAGLLDEVGKRHEEGNAIETTSGNWKVIEVNH